jgi:hypothetical protein
VVHLWHERAATQRADERVVAGLGDHCYALGPVSECS